MSGRPHRAYHRLPVVDVGDQAAVVVRDDVVDAVVDRDAHLMDLLNADAMDLRDVLPLRRHYTVRPTADGGSDLVVEGQPS